MVNIKRILCNIQYIYMYKCVCTSFKVTFSVEVFLGVSPREGKLAWEGPQQFDDVGDVVCRNMHR